MAAAVRSARRRTVLIVIAVLIGGLGFGAGVLVLIRPSAPATAPAPSPAPSAAAPATPAGIELADGCLGGPDPFGAILPAQTAAPFTDEGAAAFARTFARWSVTYPGDPNVTQVAQQVVADGSLFAQDVVEGAAAQGSTLQSLGYTASRVLPDQGAYRIPNAHASDRVFSGLTVDLILYRGLTRADGRTDEMKMFTTFLMEQEGGHWVISGTAPSVYADPFAPLPSAPWTPFDGAC